MTNERKVLAAEEEKHNYLLGPSIQVCVGQGDDAQLFHLHKNLATSRSVFFANALKDGTAWKEAEDGLVELQEEDPAVFALYIELLYYDRVPVRINLIPPDQSKAASDTNVSKDSEKSKSPQERFETRGLEVVDEEFNVLGNLYVLCEMLQDARAKALLVAAFVEASAAVRPDGRTYYPPSSSIKSVYNGTLRSDDPLRKFMTDCYVMEAQYTWFSGQSAGTYPAEFLFDVMAGMAKERDQPVDRSRVEGASNYAKVPEEKADKKT